MADSGNTGSKTDLADVLARGAISVTPPETAEDAQHRRTAEKADADWTRLQKQWLFFVSLAFVLGAAVLAAWIAFASSTASPEQQKWAMGAITAILSGFFGFMGGKALK